MAGSYPDVPSRRFAYHLDGTVVSEYNIQEGSSFGVWNEQRDMSAANLAAMNGEDFSDIFGGNSIDDDNIARFLSFVFPERREVDGVFVSIQSDTFNVAVTNFDYSTDTTGGRDGTWTTDIANVVETIDSTSPAYRNSITSTAVNNAKAVRQRFDSPVGGQSSWLGRIHLYGTIAPGETPDRLIFLDTSLGDSAFVKPLDYGDVPRGQTSVRTIKVINNSAGISFSNVVLTALDLVLDGADHFSFSLNDIVYVDTAGGGLALDTIGPGSTKTVYVKQSVPTGAATGLRAAYFQLAFDKVS